MSVLVLGSANADFIVRTERLPSSGELIVAENSAYEPGGLGVNQAIAIARQGVSVSLVASVGDDQPGTLIRQRLAEDGVDARLVHVVSSAMTGMAFVTSLPGGAHGIVVAENANHLLPLDLIDVAMDGLSSERPTIVLMQGETRPEALIRATETATARGIRVVLSLDATAAIPDDVAASCDPVILSRLEAEWMSGARVDSVAEATDVAVRLRERFPSVVVTLGAHGAVWATSDDHGHVPAIDVGHAVDVAGAGDAFAASVVVALHQGRSLSDAVAHANRAAGSTVSRPGVLTAFPTTAELTGWAPSA